MLLPSLQSASELLRKVTILVPTHNRQGCLYSILEAYKDSGLSIIVADSSSTPFARAGEYGDLQYLHLPGLALEIKLQRLAGLVATPYAVLCADDDITSTVSIQSCVEFLDSNSDHSGAHGYYLRVLRSKGEMLVEPCYCDTHRAGVSSSDPAIRLLELNQPYVPLFYAVLRTEVLREAFGPGHEMERFYASSELAVGIAAASLGKVAVLPTLHTVRDVVPGLGQGGGKNDSLLVVRSAPEYRDAYAHMVARLAGVLERASNLAPQSARQAVLASLDGFIAGYCQTGARRSFVRKLPKYLRLAAYFLAPPLAARARREAEIRRQAELRAHLTPAGPVGAVELDRILARFRATSC